MSKNFLFGLLAGSMLGITIAKNWRVLAEKYPDWGKTAQQDLNDILHGDKKKKQKIQQCHRRYSRYDKKRDL